jgi:hypothetical protein
MIITCKAADSCPLLVATPPQVDGILTNGTSEAQAAAEIVAGLWQEMAGVPAPLILELERDLVSDSCCACHAVAEAVARLWEDLAAAVPAPHLSDPPQIRGGAKVPLFWFLASAAVVPQRQHQLRWPSLGQPAPCLLHQVGSCCEPAAGLPAASRQKLL